MTDLESTRECPVCAGKRKLPQMYSYHGGGSRRDPVAEQVERLDPCWACDGAGVLTAQMLAEIQSRLQLALCPQCQGRGGVYSWYWVEREGSTQKQFVHEPCRLCAGRRHVTQAQIEAHELEKWRLRIYGFGCFALLVLGGIIGITQVLTILLGVTPWVQCCSPPNVIFTTGMIGWIVLRK
jgi:hypothetical protein